jgi:hypothetical protein
LKLAKYQQVHEHEIFTNYIPLSSAVSWYIKQAIQKRLIVISDSKKLYAFFDHTIESDLYIPELTAITHHSRFADVSFQCADAPLVFNRHHQWQHHWQTGGGAITLSFGQDDTAQYLNFPDLACFAINHNGTRVSCYPSISISEAVICHLLVDQVLPRLFAHYFKSSVFHASCIDFDDRRIAFLADSGWGKSTIAAGFHTAGHTIVTDDCLRISISDSRKIMATPSYCGPRLIEDSLLFLGLEKKTKFSSCGAGSLSKYRFTSQTSQPHGGPLQALFILSPPHESHDLVSPEIRPISGVTAIRSLLKNSYCLDVHDHDWQKHHFQRISELAANELPMFALHYPRNFQMLPKVIQTVCNCVEGNTTCIP